MKMRASNLACFATTAGSRSCPQSSLVAGLLHCALNRSCFIPGAAKI